MKASLKVLIVEHPSNIIITYLCKFKIINLIIVILYMYLMQIQNQSPTQSKYTCIQLNLLRCSQQSIPAPAKAKATAAALARLKKDSNHNFEIKKEKESEAQERKKCIHFLAISQNLLASYIFIHQKGIMFYVPILGGRQKTQYKYQLFFVPITIINQQKTL